MLGTGCGTPPQIVVIAPERKAIDVRSLEPVRISFDRAMDQQSVATRFHVEPSVRGRLVWEGDRVLSFEHDAFRAATTYRISLDGGYSDRLGRSNGLRHGWAFQTEAAPVLTGSSPAAGEANVDPAAYLGISFSRPMDLTSLARAVSLSPDVRFSLRADPADARRVVVAPESLLEPNRQYTVAVTRDAGDVDGNPLRAGTVLGFSTGGLRSLHHWVTFAAQEAPGSVPSGIWIVDENRFPRQLVGASVSAYSWSPDGTRLLIRRPDGSWADQPVGELALTLPFRADWAGFLRGGGYVYRDGGALRMLGRDGQMETIATGVGEAVVAPGGSRIAFTRSGPGGEEIRAYDVDLHTQYRIQAEARAADGLAWAPDGLALAYRLRNPDPVRSQLRVRSLHGSGPTTTAAIGDVSTPTWQGDSVHLIFNATVGTAAGPLARVFRVPATAAAPEALSPAAGLPTAGGLDVLAVAPSPDGHQIAFLALAGGRSAVWLMNADGTGLNQLTSFDPAVFPYSCAQLGWTPT